MDDLDHRLIAALRQNARASLTELSRRLGVSRGTVQNRLTRLVDTQTILGFTVRLKSGAERNRIRAIMMIEVAGRNTRRVLQALRGLPQIHALFSTNGAFDLVAEIETADLAEFDDLLSKVRQIDGIARSETSLLLGAGLTMPRAWARLRLISPEGDPVREFAVPAPATGASSCASCLSSFQ